MKQRSLLVMLLILVVLILLTGCESDDDDDRDDDREKRVTEAVKEPNKEPENGTEKKEPVSFDVGSCFSLSFSGYEGMGIVNLNVNYEELNKVERELEEKLNQIAEAEAEAEAEPTPTPTQRASRDENYGNSTVDDWEINEGRDVKKNVRKADLYGLFSTISFVVTPETDLTNGDTVTVKVHIDETMAAAENVVLERTEISRTVSGLKVVKKIDPFEGLAVKFSGSEDDATIIIDNSACSDFVRNYVLFDYNRQKAYRNGDTIKVNARWGENFYEEKIDTTHVFAFEYKEFEITGLDVYPQSLDGVDISPLVKDTWDNVTARIKNYLYNSIQGHDYTYRYFDGIKMSSASRYKYPAFSIGIEKAYLLSAKANKDVRSCIIYLFSLKYDVTGWYNEEARSAHVDTILGVKCDNFLVNAEKSVVNTGNVGFLNRDWEDDTSSHLIGIDVAYDQFVAPFTGDYIINEIDLSPYAEILKMASAEQEGE